MLLHLENTTNSENMGKRARRAISWQISAAYFWVFLSLLHTLRRRAQHTQSCDTNDYSSEKTLVTYAYAEGLGNGGEIDLHNFRFFLKLILSEETPGTSNEYNRINYNIVVSGKICTPCEDTLPGLLRKSGRREGETLTVLYRENYGMDFGGYNFSLQWEENRGSMHTYAYFVFVNSSLRGPFMPKWTPPGFHFTNVLTGFFRENPKVKLAGSYITCLPEVEETPGPIMESLFFAVDTESIHWLIEDGVFNSRESKVDAIQFGEYAILRSVTKRGGRVEGLSMRYAKGLDWTESRHHQCNDNRHSSRRGLLDRGVSPNPIEHVFVKSSWCVRATEVSVLSDWLSSLTEGYPGTEGRFDAEGYANGISIEGTSGKGGTLPADVPLDTCRDGDIRSLHVSAYNLTEMKV